MSNNIHVFILTIVIGVIAIFEIEPLQHLIIAWSIIGLGLGIFLIVEEDFEMPEKLFEFLNQKPPAWWWNFFNVWLGGTMMIIMGWVIAGLIYTFCMVFFNSSHRDWYYNDDDDDGGKRVRKPKEDQQEESDLGMALLPAPVGKK
jgi:hypothetical protein